MPPSTLTDADIAALAAGAAALEPKPGEDKLPAGAPEAPATGAETTVGAPAAEVPAADAAPAAPAAPEQPSESAVVALLKEQLAEANGRLTEAAVRERDLQARVTSMEAGHNGLLEIARNSISNMRVALGGSAGADLAGMDAVALLAEHKRVSESFRSKFKAGGVAATAPTAADTKQGETVAPPLHMAKVAAVRING